MPKRRPAPPPLRTQDAPNPAGPAPAGLAAAQRDAIRAAVIGWFAGAQRRLPWRDGYDPYAVWIAEIMLQQTQVETVRPYFARWMARFPGVAAVAAAPQQDVLKAWEGLGYYTRARNLQRAAQAMVAGHGGSVPRTLAALQALPGIGRYTAGAIASIGYDLPAPIVDGNVGRVLGRLLALDVPARSSAGQRRLWALAGALVPPRRAREFNQGLMELGALVCRPTAPACLLCPLRAQCAAFARGAPERWPPPPQRRTRPLRRGALLLIRDPAGRLLLRQRPQRGLWAGLWEPPWCERERGESGAAAARRLLRELKLPSRAGKAPGLRAAGSLAHGLTHVVLQLQLYRVTLGATAAAGRAPAPGGAACCWADAEGVAALPLARLAHKAILQGSAPPASRSRNRGRR